MEKKSAEVYYWSQEAAWPTWPFWWGQTPICKVEKEIVNFV